MELKYLLIFAGGMLYQFLLDLSCEPIRNRWRKQANYNCEKCKVWDCPFHICNYKRNKKK